MSRAELESVLEFILNKANEAEFEVIRKACEKRIRDGGAFSALGSSSSTALARGMADSVQEMMGSSMESIRDMTRGFVEGIIRKNAPELSDREIAELVESSLPQAGVAQKKASSPSLPPAMLLAMTRDFVSYSEGSMPPSRQKQLWDEMPRWQDEYWAAFPAEIKAITKACIEGKINAETFTTALFSILKL
jgi:hypothetical protein